MKLSQFEQQIIMNENLSKIFKENVLSIIEEYRKIKLENYNLKNCNPIQIKNQSNNCSPIQVRNNLNIVLEKLTKVIHNMNYKVLTATEIDNTKTERDLLDFIQTQNKLLIQSKVIIDDTLNLYDKKKS